MKASHWENSTKEDSIVRLTLLGDSYVEAFQVFDRHHFRNRIECELSENLNREIEVLNFGRSGFDLEDIFAYQYSFVKTYKSDYFLIFITKDDFHSSVTNQLVPNLLFNGDTVLSIINASESYKKMYIKYKDFPYYSTYLNMVSNCIKQHNQGLTLQKIFDKFYLLIKDENNPLAEPVNLMRSTNTDKFNLGRIEELLDLRTGIQT